MEGRILLLKNMSKAIRHHILHQSKYSVFLLEEDSSWNIPTAHLCVAFETTPSSVLKYGPNGLHLAEHYLWNVMGGPSLIDTNASTFSGGEMSVFGSCLESNLERTILSFYGGLISVAKRKMKGEEKQMFRTEQRRVTCETSEMREQSLSPWDVDGSSKMFIHNMDILHGEFTAEYLWKILTEECRIGRVVVMAHCVVQPSTIATYETISAKFEKVWDKRVKSSELPLPMYYAPPFSLLDSLWGHFDPRPGKLLYGTGLKTATIPLGDEISVPERVILDTMFSNLSPFLFNIPITTWTASTATPEPEYMIQRWDQFFLAPILTAYRGELVEEHINDAYNLSPKRLIRKYGEGLATRFFTLAKRWISISGQGPGFV